MRQSKQGTSNKTNKYSRNKYQILWVHFLVQQQIKFPTQSDWPKLMYILWRSSIDSASGNQKGSLRSKDRVYFSLLDTHCHVQLDPTVPLFREQARM